VRRDSLLFEFPFRASPAGAHDAFSAVAAAKACAAAQKEASDRTAKDARRVLEAEYR